MLDKDGFYLFSYNARSYPDPRLLLLIVSINNKLITEVGDLFTSPEFLRFIFRCRDVPTERLWKLFVNKLN